MADQEQAPQTYKDATKIGREALQDALREMVDNGERNTHRLAERIMEDHGVFWGHDGIRQVFRRLWPDEPGLTSSTTATEESSRPSDLDRKEELRELRTRQSDDAKEERRNEILRSALGQYSPIPYNPPAGLRYDNADHLWVLHVSDWHIGQYIEGAKTGGLYFHSSEVAQMQVEKMLEIMREIMRDGGREVRKILVILNGDIVEGDDMRSSQHTEIDMLVTQQTMKAFDLVRYLLDGLHELARDEIFVSSVGGNHDRASRRPGNAGMAELGYVDSYAWLIGAMLERFYADDDRMTIHNWDTFFGRLTFGGHRIVHSHGADIRWGAGAYGGVPWYPIMNAAQRYRQMIGGDLDALFLGHGHMSAQLPLDPASWVMMNGALPPSTGYVQSSFKSIRRPVQQLVALNKHGLVNTYPLYLDVGAVAERDQVWTDAPESE